MFRSEAVDISVDKANLDRPKATNILVVITDCQSATLQQANGLHTFFSVSKANGDRPNAPNILVVITDGQSANRKATLQQATELHNLGVNVLAVGVGDSVDQTELAGIASSAQNVYTVSSFDALTTLQESLERTACGVTTPPSSTSLPFGTQVLLFVNMILSLRVWPTLYVKLRKYLPSS